MLLEGVDVHQHQTAAAVLGQVNRLARLAGQRFHLGEAIAQIRRRDDDSHTCFYHNYYRIPLE